MLYLIVIKIPKMGYFTQPNNSTPFTYHQITIYKTPKTKIKVTSNLCDSIIGRRTLISSQNSSMISCAAIIFSSLIICSTWTSFQHRTITIISKRSLTHQQNTVFQVKTSFYPNPSSRFLSSLQQLSNIPPHLLKLNFSPIPQQLNPRNRQFKQGLTT